MPLTPCHAAAAWPVRRVVPALPLAPLVVGTMSPDFEYLLRLAPMSRGWHSPAGIVLYCLPASLVVVWVFERWIRPSIVRRLPAVLQPALVGTPAPIAATVAAILAGALTHIAWDGFTHAGDWGVRAFPVLRQTGVVVFGHVVAWHRVLQHVSTAAGALVVAIWVLRWWLRFDPGVRRAAAADAGPLVRAVVFVALVAATGAVANGVRAPGADASRALGLAAVGAMDGIAIGLLGVAWVDRRRAAGAAAVE